MALYAIGDLHLSLSAKKPMDIFPGWESYTERLVKNWETKILPEDTVVLAGDTSWGMSLDEALADFRLIDSLPGKKLLLKGNHDYWWTSAAKMTAFWQTHNLHTLHVLHNNAYETQGFAVCGSRGWLFENGHPHDEKIIKREAIRIEASIKAAAGMRGEKLLFLHYPPLFADQTLSSYLAIMREYGIKRCYYGHIHGIGHRHAVLGDHGGIFFSMISADYLRFDPVKITESTLSGA